VQPVERGFRRPQPPFPVLAIEAGQHLVPVTIRRLHLHHPRTDVEPTQRLAQPQEETLVHNPNSLRNAATLRGGQRLRRPPTKRYSSSIRFRSSTSWARSPSSLIICSTLRTECST